MLQEPKWFGSGIYHVDGSVVLASSRKIPAAGEPVQRGERAALVISGPVIEAWKDGGEQWKAWSSGLITAKLQQRELASYMYCLVMPLPEQQVEQ